MRERRFAFAGLSGSPFIGDPNLSKTHPGNQPTQVAVVFRKSLQRISDLSGDETKVAGIRRNRYVGKPLDQSIRNFHREVTPTRSEERRAGEACRSRRSP